MANISSAFDSSDIDHLLELEGTKIDYPRWYLGMSGLGCNCMRKLWYGLHWVKKGTISARLNRLFQVGHDAEPKIVADLSRIGMKFDNVVEDQLEFIECDGWLRGHSDGKVINVPGAEKTEHLAEFKTASDKKFKEFRKKGVKDTNFTYYMQMILYMYETKLTRALFVVYNKNDSSYYFERVHADNGLAKEYIGKAQDIIDSVDVDVFPRIGNNSETWFECKWCDYNDICFKNAKSDENCRNCRFNDFASGGKNKCVRHENKELNIEMQKEKYDCHRILDCLK